MNDGCELDKTQKEREEARTKYDDLMNSHPILYGDRHLPMTQTCMCWGIACGEGWYYPLRNLSDKLEAINLTLGRMYGFEIKAEQVKEKYGTLRFYYRVTRKRSSLYKALVPFEYLSSKLIVLGMVLEKKSLGKKFLPIVKAAKSGISKISLFLGRSIDRILSVFGRGGKREEELGTIMSGVDAVVSSMVDKAEKECYSVCEDCGGSIGTGWSKRCITTGWIRYICEDCAKKLNVSYIVEGEEDGKEDKR